MASLNGQDGLTLEQKQALLKKEALIHAESFYNYKLIARATGIDEDTLKKYRNEDKDFSDSLEQARSRFIKKNMKRAKPEFLLERLEPELFKERKEIDNNHNGEVSFINDVPRPKDD